MSNSTNRWQDIEIEFIDSVKNKFTTSIKDSENREIGNYLMLRKCTAENITNVQHPERCWVNFGIEPCQQYRRVVFVFLILNVLNVQQ